MVDSLNNMPLPKQASTAQSIQNDNGGYVPAGNGDLIAKTPSKLLTLIQDEESEPSANTNASPTPVIPYNGPGSIPSTSILNLFNDGDVIALKTSDNSYLARCEQCGPKLFGSYQHQVRDAILLNPKDPSSASERICQFQVQLVSVDTENKKALIRLQSDNGRYVRAILDPTSGLPIKALNADSVTPYVNGTIFTIKLTATDNQFEILAENGYSPRQYSGYLASHVGNFISLGIGSRFDNKPMTFTADIINPELTADTTAQLSVPWLSQAGILGTMFNCFRIMLTISSICAQICYSSVCCRFFADGCRISTTISCSRP